MKNRQVKKIKELFNYYGVKVYPKTGRAVILDKSSGAKVITLPIPKGSILNTDLTINLIRAARRVNPNDRPRGLINLLTGLDLLTTIYYNGGAVYLPYPAKYYNFNKGGFIYQY